MLANYYAGSIKAIPDHEFKELLGHPIPDGSWSGTLDMNDAICQMYYAKSFLARQAYKIMTNKLNKSIAKGTPDLNITFIYNMPFRGIAKAEWFRKGGLFLMFSWVVTFAKYLMLQFLPGLFSAYANLAGLGPAFQ